MTELERARYGTRPTRVGATRADHFLGFWLALVIEGRGGDARRARRTIEKFVRDTTPARMEAGPAYFDALRDAAALYFETTLDDPAYASTLFGLKRISAEELHGKIANEAAAAIAIMVGSNLETDTARQFPRLWLEGYLLVLPGDRELMRGALTKRPSAADAVAHLLDE